MPKRKTTMRFSSALTSILATSLSAQLVSCTAFGPRPAGRAWFSFVRGGATNTARSASTAATTQEETDAANRSGAFPKLVQTLQEITHLSRAAAVLSYDQMVFMPSTDPASRERGHQSAALAAVIHEKSIAPTLGDLLQRVQANSSKIALTGEETRVVELARKAYDRKVRIPTALASKQAALSAEAYSLWTQARAADDFDMFRDILDQEIQLAQQVATAVQTEEDKMAGKSLYATMMDEFEVGMDVQRLDHIFAEIRSALVPLIEKVFGPLATPPSQDLLLPRGNESFPIAAQEALSRRIVEAIGYDPSRGRIDVSVHPFSSSLGGKHDVRITSRFRPDDWYQGLAGSMHEAGHAMYEQNLPDSGLPLVDAALSMGLHESQSLFWERHVGLSRSFWDHAAPLVREHLPLAASPEELYAAVNAASPSLIRVEADELTYPLHVILRYNLERNFMAGRLDTKDIPSEWNAGMKKMLNVDVPSDAKGCLQDVHWSMMAFGYFPTYLIGAATAAQLAHYCQKDIADWDEKIKAGQFQEIRAWMTEKVHRHGSRYKSLDEHLQAELGEPLNPKYFIEYLTTKYTELYKC